MILLKGYRMGLYHKLKSRLKSRLFSLFGETAYLHFFLKKPRVKDVDALEELRSKNFQYQYAYELDLLGGDFPRPRYENVLVADDILKSLRKNSFLKDNDITLCEVAPLDGYITWRLSGYRGLKLFAIEYLRDNCSKIKLASDVFDYNISVYCAAVQNWQERKFNIITMLGVTYQLPDPLNVIRHVLKNLIVGGGVYYVDFIFPNERFCRPHFSAIANVTEEGYCGVKYTISTNSKRREGIKMLNRPPESDVTILYTNTEFEHFINDEFSSMNVTVLSKKTSQDYGFEWYTYKINC